MVTRTVARYAGTQAAASDAERDHANQLKTALTPEEILRRAHANSVAGVIDQIAQVAAHAFDVFTELRSESERLSERFTALVDRVDVVAAAVLDGDATARQWLPTADVSDRVLLVPELSFADPSRAMSTAMQAAYDRCEPLPPFEVLAEFCADITSHRKKFSNPEFFTEDWMERETFRQQHAEQLRGERRRHRKEQRKSMAAAPPESNNQTGDGDAGSGGVLAPEAEGVETEKERLAVQQKMKFLNIRSWKERYGTGEGKELLKLPVPRDAKQLPAALSTSDEKKKRRSLTRKSVSVVKEHEEELAALHQQGDAATLAMKAVELEAPSAHAAEVPPVREAPVFFGAFMQEIDDPGDDLEYSDFAGQSSTTSGMAVANSRDPLQTAFVDQGLSYFDPHSQGPPPPPPPPPPLPLPYDEYTEEDEEHSWTGGAPPPPPPPPEEPPLRLQFSSPYEDSDDIPPPPPPPPARTSTTSGNDNCLSRRRGSFVPPPPPPPSPPFCGEEPVQPVVRVRIPSLLNELQSKRSELRHVEAEGDGDDDVPPPPPPPPPPSGLLSPRMNLLQQIRQQQLRPVGAPPHPPPRTSAPFASSIARILERREMTAYDSDASDKSDASDSDTDWK